MALVNGYEAAIFDFGGVLVKNQTEADQARMASIARIARDEFCHLYWALRLDYDRGSLNAPDYWNALAREAGAAFTKDQISALTDLDNESWMRFDSVMWDWVAQLRAQGKRVGLLSNMPHTLGDALKFQTDRLDRFDQVTLSYQVHSVKPEPEIYQHCLQGLNTTPERALFFDDRIANVQAAEALGMRAIQFLNRDDVLLTVRE
ncbi:MAG: HAD family phosphatase [Acidobacteriaceae bacterium]|nr:HAD family phosphatase [Acidobacteriaceae bacterium]MBV9498070.1 HAD family phosphatase [Acidobacteriaceae bacterium]